MELYIKEFDKEKVHICLKEDGSIFPEVPRVFETYYEARRVLIDKGYSFSPLTGCYSHGDK